MPNMKPRHNLNLVATNNSWGGGGFSQGLQDAITRAGNADILFIAAAGNSGDDNDSTASYPSGYDNANIVAVAALVKDGTLASYSQYGATTDRKRVVEGKSVSVRVDFGGRRNIKKKKKKDKRLNSC